MNPRMGPYREPSPIPRDLEPGVWERVRLSLRAILGWAPTVTSPSALFVVLGILLGGAITGVVMTHDSSAAGPSAAESSATGPAAGPSASKDPEPHVPYNTTAMSWWVDPGVIGTSTEAMACIIDHVTRQSPAETATECGTKIGDVVAVFEAMNQGQAGTDNLPTVITRPTVIMFTNVDGGS